MNASLDRLIPKPRASEYPAYADMYIRLLPDDGLILRHFAKNLDATNTLIRSIAPARLLHRYAAGKWTVKEILGHIVDDERIYVYRALRFARNDPTELPGFDQDQFAAHSEANNRDIGNLLEEFTVVRQSTIAFFASLSGSALMRAGVANGNRSTVRALAYHIAGHELHHRNIITEKYL